MYVTDFYKTWELQIWSNSIIFYEINYFVYTIVRFSLRARYVCDDIPFNQIHGSESPEIAMKQLRYFFPVEHTLIAIKPDAVIEYQGRYSSKLPRAII